MLLAAIDNDMNIQKGSLGHYKRSEVEAKFPAFTVVDIRGEIPEGSNIHENYLVNFNQTDPDDEFYELVQKAATDRWVLDLSGPDSITVQGNETYTVKKVDGNGDDVGAGTETIEITCSRGLLSAQSLDLVAGTGSFTLTAVNETVTSSLTVICGDKNANKSIDFVL